MKYLKQYEDSFDNSLYKKYIITKVKSDKYSDIYINLYENLYFTENQNFFVCIYYYDEINNKIKEVYNKRKMSYISVDNIVYQTDDLQDAIEVLETVVTTDKFNL